MIAAVLRNRLFLSFILFLLSTKKADLPRYGISPLKIQIVNPTDCLVSVHTLHCTAFVYFGKRYFSPNLMSIYTISKHNAALKTNPRTTYDGWVKDQPGFARYPCQYLMLSTKINTGRIRYQMLSSTILMSFRISLASKFERNHGLALPAFCIPENTKSGQDGKNDNFQKPFHFVLLYAADAKMSPQGQL